MAVVRTEEIEDYSDDDEIFFDYDLYDEDDYFDDDYYDDI